MIPENVGAVIREVRLEEGLGQQDLAKDLGISVWTLNRLEHGKRRFQTEWLDRLPPKVKAKVAKRLANEVRKTYHSLRDMMDKDEKILAA